MMYKNVSGPCSIVSSLSSFMTYKNVSGPCSIVSSLSSFMMYKNVSGPCSIVSSLSSFMMYKNISGPCSIVSSLRVSLTDRLNYSYSGQYTCMTIYADRVISANKCLCGPSSHGLR